jgi:glycosyltransferase involved in cell wall biosynthesis
MISIVTVCFNSEKTIERTINSVLSQSYANVEYIIIDGGSTDGTIEIIKKYQEKITFWISESDSGLYDAMNKGIQKAQGNIIGILNSDDVFQDSNVLTHIVDFHSKHQIDASIGDVIYRDDSGDLKRVYSSKNWFPEMLKRGYMPPHASIFFSSNILKYHGLYDKSYKIAADFELIIRYFLVNKINWQHHGIITTDMLIGGVSSSGFKSYSLLSLEIGKALKQNNIQFSKLQIWLRGFRKLHEFFKKNLDNQ